MQDFYHQQYPQGSRSAGTSDGSQEASALAAVEWITSKPGLMPGLLSEKLQRIDVESETQLLILNPKP